MCTLRMNSHIFTYTLIYTVPLIHTHYIDTATSVHLLFHKRKLSLPQVSLPGSALFWSTHPPTHPRDFPDHSPASTPSLPPFPSLSSRRGFLREKASPESLPRTTAFLPPLRMGERGDAGEAPG